MFLNDSLALVFSSRPIKMSPRFVLGQENVPCVAEVQTSLVSFVTTIVTIDSSKPWSVEF